MFLFFVFVALAVWAFLGLAIWTFVLIRMTTVISMLAIWAGLTGRHDPTLGEYIVSSVGFYPRGFRRIYDNALSEHDAPPARYLSFWRAGIDSMFAILFWLGVYRADTWHAVVEWTRHAWHTYW